VQLSERRKFLLKSARAAAAAAVGGLVWGVIANESKASPLALRPPGAIDNFLATCIRCGMCVNDCPYDTLSLAKIGEDVAYGTPFFAARDIPCYMCEDIPCTAACPSGALDMSTMLNEKSEPDINKAQMGVAVVDHNNCIAYWGIQCDACYRVCPAIDVAITQEYRRNERTGKHAFLTPMVHADACTGCGMCEHACITSKASIIVLPREVALGKAGTNYIKGWESSDEQRLLDVSTKVTTKTKRSSEKVRDYLNSEELFDE